MADPWVERREIGDAVLYLGDCLEILPALGKAGCVITDPNYGIGESSRRNATRGKPFGSRRDAKNTRGTYVAPTDYGECDWDAEPASPERIALCQVEQSIIWGGNYFNLPPASKWLVWDKENSGDFADCELAWTNLPGAVRIFRHMWNGMLRASERGKPRVHLTQKPIKLMEWCLQMTTGAVADPFMGSGTTGIACANFERPFVGIEINRRDYEIACERIAAAYAQGRLFA